MVISPEVQRKLDEQKKLTEQIIRDPKFQLDSVHFDPYTPYLRSNNFVQQTASRIFGYNAEITKWFPISTDSLGRVILSSDPIDGAQIFLKDRNFQDAIVIDALVVATTEIVTHSAVDVSSLSRKSILVSSSGTVIMRVEFSHDSETWFQWYDTNDQEITFSIDNQNKSIEVIDVAHYMRVTITNTSGVDSIVTVVISGMV